MTSFIKRDAPVKKIRSSPTVYRNSHTVTATPTINVHNAEDQMVADVHSTHRTRSQAAFIKVLAPVANHKRSGRKTPASFQPLKTVEVDTDVCNILHLDQQITKNLLDKREALPSLREQLKNIVWIMTQSPDPLDRIQATADAVTLRNTINDIEYGMAYALYVFRTSRILEAYKSVIGESTDNVTFIKTTEIVDIKKVHHKNKLILAYLRIAKEYVNLENFKQKINKPTCDSCYSTNLIVQENSLTCECGNVMEQLDDAPTFKDSERVNMSSRYTYTCRGHIMEAMNRFEGKQNTTIDDDTIEALKAELLLHGLTAKNTTKDHVYRFMTENKMSDYYADVNLIYFKITTINPPDITQYRDELLEMHDQLEEAYMEVKDEERLNSLNVNWKLYKLLQLVGYQCKKDDFFCLKTPAKQAEHEQKWYDMIEYLKIKYPTVVTSSGKKRWRHVRSL